MLLLSNAPFLFCAVTFGSYLDHIEACTKLVDEPNVMTVIYEELKEVRKENHSAIWTHTHTHAQSTQKVSKKDADLVKLVTKLSWNWKNYISDIICLNTPGGKRTLFW